MSHAIRAQRNQRYLLPPDLDEWIGPEHPARFVADIVDNLDLEALGFRTSRGDEGRPHFAPELLLGVWLYGWMERIRSTRALEKALHTQIAFLWLAGMEKPDHVTLWRFFADNKKALRKLFKVVVQTAAKAGLVGFALHALDGTKLSAACSTETALHRKGLEDELKRVDEIVEASMAEVEAHQREPSPEWKMPQAMQVAQKRKEKIQSALKMLDDAEVNHLNEGEPEARLMKTRDGIKLGYNAQIVVDHDSDLVVAADVVAEATDHEQLVPMVEQVAETLGKTADETVADTGYASGAQLLEAEQRGLPVIVPPQEESSAKGEYAKSKFRFDGERDVYVCPRGQDLPLHGIQSATTGKPALRVYRCHNMECPVRARCTDDKRGRAIKRYPGEEATARQTAKLALPDKRILFSLRKEIVEHLFGILKVIDGFRRFTAWGLEGAQTQWALACTAVNLRKLIPALRNGQITPASFG